MKLGIKIAPGNAWKRDIESAHPQMVEIWYNASHPDDYNGIFAYLRDKPIDVGLHFWGTLPNNILANTSYPDLSISVPSIALMYATIDVAATHTCAYVNIHPDLYSLLHVNFDSMDVSVTSEQADPDIMRKTFLRNILTLTDYAKTRGVVLTVETVPMRDTPSWSWKIERNRTDVIDIHQMSVDVLIDLAAHEVAIANDFGHTAGNLISDDRNAIWQFLYGTTKTLAPSTRLIHCGFIIPPYNGVDYHGSLDNPVFATDDAIPNSTEMVELLKIFRSRDDMWMLVEPKNDHVKNYLLARGILENAGVLTK
jgi:sugar phosphate isomerase/epimerase